MSKKKKKSTFLLFHKYFFTCVTYRAGFILSFPTSQEETSLTVSMLKTEYVHVFLTKKLCEVLMPN